MRPKTYSIAQARARLARIVSDAQAGEASVITRRGVPIAAVVPVENWRAQKEQPLLNANFLSLRGTGRGLWDDDSASAVTNLRDEWSVRVSID